MKGWSLTGCAEEDARDARRVAGVLNIPFYVFEAPSKAGIAQSLKSIFKPSTVSKELTPEQLETYKSQLLQRTELIFDGLVGMGLKTRTLEKDDLMNLFYGLYNPSTKSAFGNTEDKNLDLK